MTVGDLLANVTRLVRIGDARPAANNAAQATPPAAPNPVDAARARRLLVDFLKAISELDRAINGSSDFAPEATRAISTAALGLDLASTAARLNSTDEVNATPTSYNPFGPDWTGSSTAELTLDGIYDGSNGTGALTFEVFVGGVRGVNDLQVRVRDPQSTLIDTVIARAVDPVATQYPLSNGLTVAVGSGNLFFLDTATANVFDAVGSALDPAKPFGGTRNDNPNFQFDTTAIANGSFNVNGQAISVATTDTLNDVLARINASNAGVAVDYDTNSELVEFTQLTDGSSGQITLDNDSSNLLDALKLSGATLVPGTNPETQRALNTVTPFAGIQAGTALIDSTAIAIDPANDSLDQVIARINASGADVNATFNSATQRVQISGTAGEPTAFTLDSNGTNFFTAVNIADGEFVPSGSGKGYTQAKSSRLGSTLDDALSQLNALFDDDNFSDADNPLTASVRARLFSALTNAVSADDGRTDTGFGLIVNGSDGARADGRVFDIDRAELARRFRRNGRAINAFLGGSQSNSGLIGQLGTAASASLIELNASLGFKGSTIDLLA